MLGATGAAFVFAVDVSEAELLQPVSSTLAARPISTIRVISLFIVGVTLTKKGVRTSKNCILFYWGVTRLAALMLATAVRHGVAMVCAMGYWLLAIAATWMLDTGFAEDTGALLRGRFFTAGVLPLPARAPAQ